MSNLSQLIEAIGQVNARALEKIRAECSDQQYWALELICGRFGHRAAIRQAEIEATTGIADRSIRDAVGAAIQAGAIAADFQARVRAQEKYRETAPGSNPRNAL